MDVRGGRKRDGVVYSKAEDDGRTTSYPDHRWTLDVTSLAVYSNVFNPFIRRVGHALHYPQQNVRFHCRPANNAAPRSRVLFSIVVRQVCIKLANCAESPPSFALNYSSPQSCFPEENDPSPSIVFLRWKEKNLLLGSNGIASHRNRNERDLKWGKKWKGGNGRSQFVGQIGRSVWLIRFYWGARETTPPPSLTGLTGLTADPAVSLLPR